MADEETMIHLMGVQDTEMITSNIQWRQGSQERKNVTKAQVPLSMVSHKVYGQLTQSMKQCNKIPAYV